MPQSKEVRTKNILSRSEFFSVVGLGLVTAATPRVMEFLSQPPDFDPAKEIDSQVNFSHRSFIEHENLDRKNIPPFIDPKKGPGLFVAHAITNTPILAYITKQAYERTLSQPEKILANTITDHLSTARNALEKIYPTMFSLATQQEIQMQTWSAAVYSLSGLLGSWMSIEQIQSIGVSMPAEMTRNQESLYKIWQHFPPFIPFDTGDLKENEYNELFMSSGKDRSVHFVNHLFMTFKYLQFALSQMQDADRIPLASRLAFLLTKDTHKQAEMLSSQGSIVWEIIETLKFENQSLKGFTHQGLLDPTVWKGDFIANKLGSETGIAIYKALEENQLDKIFQILKRLDDPKYTQPQHTLYRNPYGRLALIQN